MFSVAPFLRYHIPAGKNFLYFEAFTAFGTLKYSWEYENNGYSDNGESTTGLTSFGGGAGLVAPLSNKVAFDLMMGYISTSIKDKDDNDDNEKTVIGTFGIKFGVVVFLGKDKE